MDAIRKGPVLNLMKLSLETNTVGGYTKENAPGAMLELEAKGRVRRQRAATKKISILDDVDTYLAEERLSLNNETILAQGTGQSEETAERECAWDAVQKLFKRNIIAEASVEFTTFTHPPHPDAKVRLLIAAKESDFEAMLSTLGV
ncbi:hypothetical protein AAVH_04562 [Aphelenchoides avenae]|nr:hypothetical protein AAVH_04562 [Aphelenchus avenae]